MSETLHFGELEELFHRAADLPAAERGRVLDPVRRSNPELAAEVERLLQREDRRGGLSDLGPLVARAVEGSETSALPGGFGPYEVVRRLGAGGMGVVFEARQSEPIERRVAIKVVSASAESERVTERFAAESRTLALMHHPNVAAVLDAGATADGRPFFVMEYVEGEPITDYCDGERLGVNERLRLFLDLCGAVQHAHQKGVIHRDLKPSNVLVGNADGGPIVAKVIDFGIAKVLDVKPGLGPDPARGLTRFGEAVGTPAYMSPEQARGGSEDIDTRADIYSLGVILYELLAGHLPFDDLVTPQAPANAARDPARPSERLRDPDEATTEIALRRRTTPVKLAARLRDDLDWIALKALAVDREERYASAAELGADIERHLADEPVLDAASAEASLREALAIQERRLGAGDEALGTTLNELALLLRDKDPAEAARLYRKSYEIVRGLRGEDNGDAGILLANIGGLELRQDHFVAARDLYERALPLVAEHHGENDPRTGGILGNLALVYLNLGDNGRALELQRRGLELSQRALGPEHPNVGVDWLTLARTSVKIGDQAGAFEQIEHAREIFEKSLGPGHPLSLTAQKTHAWLYIRSDRLDEARRILEHGLASARDDSGVPIAPVMSRLLLAEVERLSGRFETALELVDGVIANPLVQADPISLEDAVWTRAYTLAGQGDRAGADRERRRAIDEVRRLPGFAEIAGSMSP